MTRRVDNSDNFWPFAAINICPTVYEVYQSRLTILSNTKLIVKKLPKTTSILPKFRNFVESGHADAYLPARWRDIDCLHYLGCFKYQKVVVVVMFVRHDRQKRPTRSLCVSLSSFQFYLKCSKWFLSAVKWPYLRT